MTVRWTEDALRDLESIHSFISSENREAAAVVIEKIVASIDGLGRHPYIGRKGRVAGTRELVVAPYIVAYRIRRSAVEVVAIIHRLAPGRTVERC